jgi:hypothetical protein
MIPIMTLLEVKIVDASFFVYSLYNENMNNINKIYTKKQIKFSENGRSGNSEKGRQTNILRTILLQHGRTLIKLKVYKIYRIHVITTFVS